MSAEVPVRPRPVLLRGGVPWIVGAVALGMAVTLVVLSYDTPGFSQPRLLLIAGVGVVMVGAGTASTANGEGRIGLLVTLAGYSWLLERLLGAIDNQVVYSASAFFPGLWVALLLWALMTFPGGTFRSGLDRALVVGFFVLQVGGQWLITLTIPRWEPRGGSGPNEMVLFPNGRLAADVSEVADRVTIALLLLLAAILVHRMATSTPPVRRAYGFVWVGGIVLCLLLALLISAGLGLVDFDEAYGRWLEYLAGIIPITMAVSLVAARVAQDRLVSLVVDLESGERGERLVASLRTSLGDPALDLVYRAPGGDGWIDGVGTVCDVEGESDQRAVTPVVYRGSTVAALVHDPVLLRNPERLSTAIAAAGLAIDNERLQAELRATLAEVRASRTRIVEAGDRERRRVERNLHDGAQQRLVALGLTLNLAARKVDGDPEAAALVAEAADDLDAALAELRELARGLHPSIVTDLGLGGALEDLAQRPGTPVSLELDLPGRLHDHVAVAAYYVVAEALANVNKHAAASSVVVRAAVSDDALRATITDDGCGGAVPRPGSGLEGLGDRVGALGGHLMVESPVGSGTTVSVDLPLS